MRTSVAVLFSGGLSVLACSSTDQQSAMVAAGLPASFVDSVAPDEEEVFGYYLGNDTGNVFDASLYSYTGNHPTYWNNGSSSMMMGFNGLYQNEPGNAPWGWYAVRTGNNHDGPCYSGTNLTSNFKENHPSNPTEETHCLLPGRYRLTITRQTEFVLFDRPIEWRIHDATAAVSGDTLPVRVFDFDAPLSNPNGFEVDNVIFYDPAPSPAFQPRVSIDAVAALSDSWTGSPLLPNTVPDTIDIALNQYIRIGGWATDWTWTPPPNRSLGSDVLPMKFQVYWNGAGDFSEATGLAWARGVSGYRAVARRFSVEQCRSVAVEFYQPGQPPLIATTFVLRVGGACSPPPSPPPPPPPPAPPSVNVYLVGVIGGGTTVRSSQVCYVASGLQNGQPPVTLRWYQNGAWVKGATSAPWSSTVWSWNADPLGYSWLKVIATDAIGRQATDSVRVRVTTNGNACMDPS